MGIQINGLSTRIPVVAICGATGTGKSKLAIDLAAHVGGEVINADAIQLYKGLDIASNKVTDGEKKGVVHHLLGFLDPAEGFWYNVHQYRRDCCHLIDTLRERRVTPFVVGGTHYYLEAVLWQNFLRPTNDLGYRHPLSTWSPELLARLPKDPKDYYAALWNADPEVARHLHPNDSRKLQQALLINLSRELEGVSATSASPSSTSTTRSSCPRYPPPDSLIFWLDCCPSHLKSRLDERVSKMIQRGLIRELDEFLAIAAKSLLPNDLEFNDDGTVTEAVKKAIFQFANEGLLPSVGTEHWCRGVLQTIGFKEFEGYLQLSPCERNCPTGEAILAEAVEKMKIATRQYSRRQLSWIKNRFLRRTSIDGIPVYRLDVTPVLTATSPEDAESLWVTAVLEPCLRILRGDETSQSMVSEKFFEKHSSTHAPDFPPPPYICAACNGRVFVDPLQWTDHLNSRSHKKRIASLKKRTM